MLITSRMHVYSSHQGTHSCVYVGMKVGNFGIIKGLFYANLNNDIYI